MSRTDDNPLPRPIPELQPYDQPNVLGLSRSSPPFPFLIQRLLLISVARWTFADEFFIIPDDSLPLIDHLELSIVVHNGKAVFLLWTPSLDSAILWFGRGR